MQPTTFEEANVALTKPVGMTDEEVQTLHAFTDGRICISLWKPSWRERLLVLFTGKIWLGILSGRTQPPVWLRADYPFVEARENNE